MARIHANRRILAVLVVSSLLVSGCVSPRIIAGSAVSFNLAVEQAQNEMLLLNAVRASKRRPMYITGISKVIGSARVDVGANVDIPLSDPVRTVSTRASYVVNPTYEVPVLDTQEFMQGFLKPVPNRILAYYWDQGWPRTLLLHLLVQRVKVRTEETVNADGKLQIKTTEYVFDNYPSSRDEKLCRFVKFSKLVNLFLAQETNPRFEMQDSGRAIGPKLPEAKLSLADLLTANREQLEVVSDGEKLQIRQQQPTLMLVTVDLQRIAKLASDLTRDDALCQVGESPESAPVTSYKPAPSEGAKTEAEASPREEPVAVGILRTGPPELTIEFSLRSPEGVLYYLGQLLRVEETMRTPEICIQGRYEPIFVASTECGGRGVASVGYDGLRYTIPREGGDGTQCEDAPDHYYSSSLECRAGRSMQSLSLLNQLIALHKSAKDMPGTSVVRTIGQ